jgi:protocatechuate 3,4-dioxygenase beta subunit
LQPHAKLGLKALARSGAPAETTQTRITTMSTNTKITRRQVIRTAGGVSAAYLLAPTLTSAFGERAAIAATRCATLTPELTEGPYWVNTMLHRSDVRSNSHGGGHQIGVPLALTINVADLTNDCTPLDGVAVDIWHANAHGLYSDESSQQAGGGTSGGNTSNDNWLRGYQISGKDHGINHKPASGQVSFETIWPGWYTGRAIHIHVRVRKLSHNGATIAGYTTQIFFTDADNSHVLTGAAPYNTRSPQTDPTTDQNDTVLTSADFATNVVNVKGSIQHGYATTFNIALDNAELDAKGSLARPNAQGGASPQPSA